MGKFIKLPGARLKVGPDGQLLEQLGFYSLAPGARLMVGPHGQLEEQLGACCAPCAKSGGSCGDGALGADDSNAVIGAAVVGAIGLAAWVMLRSHRKARRGGRGLVRK